MILDLEKEYTLEEFIELNDTTDFPIEIGGQVICGFELLRNGNLLPIPQTPSYKEWAVARLVTLLQTYADSSICPGNVTSSQGGYKFEENLLEINEGNGHPKRTIRAPDVAFVPKNVVRDLQAEQLFTFKGESFTPTFLIEVEDISLDATYEKIRGKVLNDYFCINSSVELVWLIDPENKRCVEFYKNRRGRVVWTDHNPWQNLSGRNALPEFTLRVNALKYNLDRNLMSSSDEENDNQSFKCPKCEFTYTSDYDFNWHYQDKHAIPAQDENERRKRARKSLSPRKKRK